jgi:hypothetical protein
MAASAKPYVAYVGVAGDLQGRLLQHLSYRDSSVVTGASATSINPDLIGGVVWWSTDEMEDRATREAAELVAFEVLDPALRSRGAPGARAIALAQDADFRQRIMALLADRTNAASFPSVEELGRRIRELERRVEELESRSEVQGP